MPAHDPHPGQAVSSSSLSSSSVIFPALTPPTPSNTVIRSVSFSPFFPAIMGPPLIKTAGMLSLIAAISIPGTILSQFGIRTRPSKGWAIAMTSTESAISSRLESEYFIPSWFIAIPSQTPMVGNSMGVPPAIRIPAFTASAIVSR